MTDIDSLTSKGVKARTVTSIHKNADTDGSTKAIHHTLGPAGNQASPGNHTHDGGQSAILTDFAPVVHTHSPIKAKMQANTNQSIPTGANTLVQFQVSNYDNDNMVDLANNRLLIKTAGWYRFYARVAWANNATSYRGAIIFQNANFCVDSYVAPVNGNITVMLIASEPILCAVNDAFTLQVFHAISAAPLNIQITNNRWTHLAAEMVGP